MMAPSICIVDVDVGVGDAGKVAAALQRQIVEHYAPDSGVLASIRVGKESYPSECRLELRAKPTIDGAFGYHDEDENGLPILYVFPELCAEMGVAWSSTTSHEVLETLSDMYLRKCVQDESTGAIYALENCDAVETLSYDIDGVEVSDFCLSAWFEPPRNLAGVRFDFLGKCTEPFQVLPGGYAQTWSGNGWTQLGNQRAYRAKLAEMGLSRGIRRKALGMVR